MAKSHVVDGKLMHFGLYKKKRKYNGYGNGFIVLGEKKQLTIS